MKHKSHCSLALAALTWYLVVLQGAEVNCFLVALFFGLSAYQDWCLRGKGAWTRCMRPEFFDFCPAFEPPKQKQKDIHWHCPSSESQEISGGAAVTSLLENFCSASNCHRLSEMCKATEAYADDVAVQEGQFYQKACVCAVFAGCLGLLETIRWFAYYRLHIDKGRSAGGRQAFYSKFGELCGSGHNFHNRFLIYMVNGRTAATPVEAADSATGCITSGSATEEASEKIAFVLDSLQRHRRVSDWGAANGFADRALVKQHAIEYFRIKRVNSEEVGNEILPQHIAYLQILEKTGTLLDILAPNRQVGLAYYFDEKTGQALKHLGPVAIFTRSPLYASRLGYLHPDRQGAFTAGDANADEFTIQILKSELTAPEVASFLAAQYALDRIYYETAGHPKTESVPSCGSNAAYRNAMQRAKDKYTRDRAFAILAEMRAFSPQPSTKLP
ncbi:unnamed protein product [Amoebophrya sp. A25]|nr:unnamed protein product [Amoebophrya sp. A25]|eukprot:GSA25T00012583001.1